MDVFLVTIHTDPIIRSIVSKPMFFMAFSEGDAVVETIPKDAVVCNVCNVRVGVTEEEVEELGLPAGYAVCDEEAVIEVVCQGCRLRYFQGVKAFRTLDDLQQKPTFI